MIKALLIEDDPMMVNLYQKAFAAEGIEVDIARDGEEGLNRIRDTSPDIILLDIMMPKMNGMEVLEKVKSNQVKKAIPIIILTNLASEKNEEIALAKGAARYLIKDDYDPKQVIGIMKEVLGVN